MVKRYSILFFLSNCLATHFFIQFTQSAMFEKKLIKAPYISDQFYYYRSDLPTLLSTFSKISQNFRHYRVFYMHTITCSFQAEEQWKKHFYLFIFCIFHWFGRRVGSRQRGCKHFSEFFQGGFLLRIFFLLKRVGFSIYKYLRNQGRKRCKTNVNFQFIVTFLYCFVQNGTIHEKKAQSFFAAAQYCGRKIGHGLLLGWATPLTFFSFFYISIFLAELFCSVFKWIDCLFVCFVFFNQVVILKSQIRFVLANK
jgi:hypothetical protein